MNQTVYLNDSGSRWRIKGYRVHVYDVDGSDLGTRAVDAIEALGNFGALIFRVRGVRYRAIAESFPDEAGIAIARLDKASRYG